MLKLLSLAVSIIALLVALEALPKTDQLQQLLPLSKAVSKEQMISHHAKEEAAELLEQIAHKLKEQK
jgi:hypothetical protein